MNDATFLAQLEAGTWPLDAWHHREHIKAAYLYLLQSDFDIKKAADAMRACIQAYNAAQQVPEAIDSGYHETITQAWMQLVAMTLGEYGPCENADAFVDRHRQLLSKHALLLFYTRDRIMSPAAKRGFVEPDLTPLPRSTSRRRGEQG
jgi:hypothetical protein